MTDQQPRLFQHTLALYEKMVSESNNGEWTGSLVGVFRSLGISQSYYSPIYKALKEIGSIEVVHSGRGGGARSRVKLHKPPTLDEFTAIYKSPLTSNTRYDTLERRIETLEGRMPDIDLASYIVSLEERLQTLENQGRSR